MKDFESLDHTSKIIKLKNFTSNLSKTYIYRTKINESLLIG